MYSMVSLCCGRYSLEKARTFASVLASSRLKIESKKCACCAQPESLAIAANGEPGAGGRPARKRAVSSGVAVSALRAGAMASAKKPAKTTANRAAAKSLGTVESIGLEGDRTIGIGRRHFRDESERIVDYKPRRHQPQAAKRLQRPIHDKIVHHEQGQTEENQRRNGVAPGAVRPHQFGVGDAHLDHAQDREKRAERQAELDEIEHRLKALSQQQEVRDHELKGDCGRRY